MSAAISALVLIVAMLAHAGATPATTQGQSGGKKPVPTACSLMTPQEIAGITGGRILDGEPQEVSEGTECRFRSSASSWVNIALGPIDAKAFGQLRKLVGKQAEDLAGVGDEAFFWGNVRIHVRVGAQSLTIGLARNDDGNATTKAHVLALAKLGASRLR